MKIKRFIILAVFALALAVAGIFLLNNEITVNAGEAIYGSSNTIPEKHLILNADGSYGGNRDLAVYGEGAPLNGKLDNPTAGYYRVHDIYNATSTSTRVMIHNFRGYQQTMANTDGLACVLMALNLFGYDTNRLYSEARLLQRYQDATGEKLTDDVTAAGLQLMLSKMGIFSSTTTFKDGGYSRSFEGVVKFVKDCLANNQIILMPFWGDNDYKWYAVIGVDEQNDKVVNNDMLILADPFDAADHYQDGYREIYVHAMLKYWLDIDRDITLASGASKETYTYACENLVINCPNGFKLNTEVGEETITTINDQNAIPEIHLLPYYDIETKQYYYGGKMQADDYTTPWGGADWKIYNKDRSDDMRSTFDTIYGIFTDWYEKDDEGTLLMLHHYATTKQTTASTCGVCSTLSALVYLGIPYDATNRNLDDYTCTNEYKIMKQIERDKSITIYNRGIANYEIPTTVAKYGIKSLHSSGYNMTNYLSGKASKVYPTFASFSTQVKEDLAADNPFLIGWNSTGGHWQVVIGYDDMGTPELYDDFCILADSSDWHDGLLDGYNVWSAYQVYNRWYNGSFHWNQQGLALSND